MSSVGRVSNISVGSVSSVAVSVVSVVSIVSVVLVSGSSLLGAARFIANPHQRVSFTITDLCALLYWKGQH